MPAGSGAHRTRRPRDRGAPPGGLRPLVRASWQRCLVSGVDPDDPDRRGGLDGDALRTLRDAHPLTALMPLLRRLLVDNAAGGGHIAALADARGRLLWVDGDRTLRSRAERMRFTAGADWGEQSAGTNAPGLALAVGHPVQVRTAEHFGVDVRPWSCSAAPVRDPDTGAVLGVLDLTGDDSAASPQAMALVQAAAAAAEGELRLRRLRGAEPRAGEDGSSGAAARLRVLGTRRPVLTAGGRRIPLSPRHAEILFLLSRRPGGLTGEGIAALLDERDAAPVTIRAEVARLRRSAGAHLVQSRPYRLAAACTSDADDVRSLLLRGDPAGAFAAYPGPLLPGSDAPGVAQAREELAAELRGALERAGAGELLAAWAARDDGRGDPRLHEAALRSLPADSPRRAALTAALDEWR
ncbi:GAF domain-containing protein [Nocardiopsis coralliicola]